jgi:predicted GNAT family acetyltransferase
MPLEVLTEHAAIAAELDRLLAPDPVQGTVLGTIRAVLGDTAWAARHDCGLAVRSSEEHPVLLAGEWPDAELAALAGLLRELPGFHALAGPNEAVAALVPRVAAGREAHEIPQRLYRLDVLTPPDGVPGEAALARAADVALLQRWYVDFMVEVGDVVRDREAAAAAVVPSAVANGEVFVWVDGGRLVSMAARRQVVAGSARVGPVYTPPSLRGRGYASALTAVASQSILDEGAVPVLYADLGNPTSKKIYQQLGYHAVQDRLVVSFT